MNQPILNNNTDPLDEVIDRMDKGECKITAIDATVDAFKLDDTQAADLTVKVNDFQSDPPPTANL